MVVIRHVPAYVCENCGEVYLESEANKQVMEIGQAAAAAGTVVPVEQTPKVEHCETLRGVSLRKSYTYLSIFRVADRLLQFLLG